MRAVFGGLALFALVGLVYFTSNSAHSQDNTQKLHRRNLKPGPQIKHNKNGEHNEHYDHASFDPVAAHATHELDDEYDEHYRGGYYDNDWEGGFNITERLHELFPLIDTDKDGVVTKSEMEKWHYHVGMNQSKQRAEREFDASDEDSDGKISLKEYLGEDFELLSQVDQPPKEGEEAPYNLEWVRSTRDTFNLADEDGDHFLSRTEFFKFLHPEESEEEKVSNYLLSEAVRDRDSDKDGKLTFNEFKENLWHEIKPWDEDNEPEDWHHDYHEVDMNPEDTAKDEANAKKRFEELDTNKDGHLEAHELKPELKTLHPGEKDFAERQASHMIEQADDNQDGNLTLAEMVENPYVFYSAAVGDDDSYYHDEFK